MSKLGWLGSRAASAPALPKEMGSLAALSTKGRGFNARDVEFGQEAWTPGEALWGTLAGPEGR